jgi:hypothetical protein
MVVLVRTHGYLKIRNKEASPLARFLWVTSAVADRNSQVAGHSSNGAAAQALRVQPGFRNKQVELGSKQHVAVEAGELPVHRQGLLQHVS